MYFNLLHFRSKTKFTMSMYTRIKFFSNRQWEIVQILFILKLEPDLEPDKLSEHGVYYVLFYDFATDQNMRCWLNALFVLNAYKICLYFWSRIFYLLQTMDIPWTDLMKPVILTVNRVFLLITFDSIVKTFQIREKRV